MTHTDKFLTALDALAAGPIPERVYDRAKRSLLDYICVTMAGASYLGDKLDRYLAFAEPEAGRYTAVGTGRKLALKDAVFLNGLNAHALDFDDGTNTGIIHLGSPVFSVLLPLAQRYELSYEKLFRAAILGYEASFTMALSIQPGHKLMGYHATGTCGTLGAALAIAYALDFTEEERRAAFAAACAAASGVLKVLDDGSELKPYNVAKTALLALTAAQLGRAGFAGHPDPLGGDRGFLKMMTGCADTALQSPLYNGTWAVEKTYTKPFAACRYCHPSIEAAVSLRGACRPEEIRDISIRTYDLAVRGHDHAVIPSVASAKMSIPYSVAVGTLYGRAGLEEFTDGMIRDGAVTALAAKVHVTADDELSASFPAKQTAVVEISTDRGVFSRRVDFPKGEPENPMTEPEFRERFDAMCRFAGCPEEKSERIYRMAAGTQGSPADVLELL